MSDKFLIGINISLRNLKKARSEVNSVVKGLSQNISSMAKSSKKSSGVSEAKRLLKNFESSYNELDNYYKEGAQNDSMELARNIQSNMIVRYLETTPAKSRATGALLSVLTSDDFVKQTISNSSGARNIDVFIGSVSSLNRATRRETKKSYSSSILDGSQIAGYWEFQEAGPIHRDYLISSRKSSLHQEDRELIQDFQEKVLSKTGVLIRNLKSGRA